MDGDWWADRLLSMATSVLSSATLGGVLNYGGKLFKTGEKLLDLGRFKPKGGNFEAELESLYK